MYSSLLIVSCLVILGSTASDIPIPNLLDPSSLNEKLEQYLNTNTSPDILFNMVKQLFGKKYVSITEEINRRNIFKYNLDQILANNELFSKGLSSYKMGINEFIDKDPSEVVKERTGLIIPKAFNASNVFKPDANFMPPLGVDWREKGYVTPVKNQGNCGSCWAFSAISALEGQNFKKTGKLVSLSEQQLVDCASDFGNYGCGGGAPVNAYNYIVSNGGVDTGDAYPYDVKAQRNCNYNPGAVGASCTSYKTVDQSENSLMIAVATVGPIAVCIDASLRSFQSYKSGIYDDSTCSTTPNHAVVIVGFGKSQQGQDYWIARNSWGASWGDNGYIYMARNKNNQCGVALYASYPVL